MNVLAVGLPPATISRLCSRNFSVYTGDSILTVHNLERWLKSGIYDACVIAISKDGFGLTIARTLRTKEINTTLVGITETSEEKSWSEYRAVFLEQGGDDLLRGSNPRELAASLHAIARRMKLDTQDKLEYHFGGAHLVVNNHSYQVTLNNTAVSLMKREMELLQLFAKTPNRIFTEEAIVARMYALDNRPESNAIAVHVSRLRIKLRTIHPDGEKFIKFIRGRGYMFQPQGSH